MKARFISVSVTLGVLIIFLGCSIDDPTVPSYEYSRCFTVIDSQTEEPVNGALLRIYYDTNSDSPLGSGGGREGITDIDGSICFTIPRRSKGDGWQVFGNHYKPICKLYAHEFPPDVIEMDFETYFQFEIKNEEPFSEADNIKITYSDILECGSNNFISLDGANVDTTIIRRSDPVSPSIIEVESSGANPFTKSHARIVKSRDTIIFTVLY